MDSPFVGPSYNLDSRPASVQRTVNLMPVPIEPGNERAGWVFRDMPGLVAVSQTLVIPPEPEAPHVCEGGPTWHATVRPSGQSLGLAYLGSDIWVATCRGQPGSTPTPTIRSTDNGASWSAGGTITNVANSHPYALCYAPALGAGGRLACYIQSQASTAYSDDKGVTWTVQTHGVVIPCDLKFGNGKFVFLNDAGANVYETATGLTPFTSRTLPAQGASIHWIAAAGWWLLFARGGSGIWTSPDLITWTLRQANPSGSGAGVVKNLVAQNGLNLVAGFNTAHNKTLYSSDGGVTWAESGIINFTGADCIGYGNGAFILSGLLAGQTRVSADNGQTWQVPISTLTDAKVWVFAHDGTNTWVAVGGNGTDDTIANQGVC